MITDNIMNSNHPTHYKGDCAEVAVQYDLIFRGYLVFKPINQNSFADLVILRNNKLESIQIKCVTPYRGALQIQLHKRASTTTKIETTYRYKDTPLDWLAIFNSETRLICYLPRQIWENNSSGLSVRTELTKNNQSSGIYYFENFRNI